MRGLLLALFAFDFPGKRFETLASGSERARPLTTKAKTTKTTAKTV
jgi:hypothetical protein